MDGPPTPRTPLAPAGARRLIRVRPVALLLAAATLTACSSPLARDRDQELRRSVVDSVRRELVEAEKNPLRSPVTPHRNAAEVLGLADRADELERISGPNSRRDSQPDLGTSLLGPDQPVVRVSLERMVATAVEHNLNLQFARLAPAISESQVTAAESVFDWVLFANFNWTSQDRPQTSPSIGGAAVGLSADERQIVSQSVGVRKAMTTGGQITIQTENTYTDVETPNLTTQPDPAYESNIVLQLDQPLLRGFGSQVALAQVRLTRNQERDDIESLRSDLLQVVTNVETAYWALFQTHEDLKILDKLHRRGVEVYDKLYGRRNLDVTPAQLADARASVETRKADILRAQRVLRDASDQLKLLVNDPELTIGSEVLLLPSDVPVYEAVEYSLYDALKSAVDLRPEVQRALISIDNTAIRQELADNARLAQLDLQAQLRYSGLGDSTSDNYSNLTDGSFIDYLIGLAFEQPIGNRGAEAEFRRRRLERMQAVIAYRNTVTGIVGEVKSAMRLLVTNHTLMEQQRIARVAQAENLRTLEVEERTIRRLTADFLDLKLRRQQALASAEQQELRAIVDYNTALATIHAATGTALARNRIAFDVQNVVEPEAGHPLLPTYWNRPFVPPQPAPPPEIPAGGTLVPVGGETPDAVDAVDDVDTLDPSPADAVTPEDTPAPERAPATPAAPPAGNAVQEIPGR